jgi:hypothetical protein
MISTREFLEMTAKLSGAAVLTGCAQASRTHDGIVVNYVPSRLNDARSGRASADTGRDVARGQLCPWRHECFYWGYNS